MRLDHFALRVNNRNDTVKFLQDAFGYKFQAEFEIFFNDEKTEKALCTALEPPEKKHADMDFCSKFGIINGIMRYDLEYHLAPEIFVSEGTPGSIVWNWVQARGGIGGIHHLAYAVEDVELQKRTWIEKGWGEFSSENAFKCDDLTQIFSKPHKLTGVIFEFIERKGHGFCKENVKELMKSTAALDGNMKD